MSGTWELIITGCGTSHGSPPWGIPEYWSENPRDHRRRSGAVLKGPDGQIILIDVGPDLMHQLRDPYKRMGQSFAYPEDCITRCDAVLLTHDHADHCHGINELRHLNRLTDAEIPVYGHQSHLDAVQQMFGYCFADVHAIYEKGSPALRACSMEYAKVTTIAGLDVTAFEMSHGSAGITTGFRISSMAYLTDLKTLPAAADEHLQGLELLVLDMLREEVHPTHLCWQEASEIIERLQPKSCLLTHMGFEVHYDQWQERLPPHVHMAFDGISRKLLL